MLWRSGRVLCDGYLEALLQQFAQVRFNAHVGQHSAENDLADPAFAQLQHEIVGLRPPDAMRCGYDRFAVLDIRLETLQPVSAGTRQALNRVGAFASEEPIGGLVGFERSVEFPSFVRWIEIVRRDEHLEAERLRSLEDALHVLDGLGFLETIVNERPRESSITQ